VPLPAKEAAPPGLITEYEYDQKDRAARGMSAISISEFKNKSGAAAAGQVDLIGKDGQPVDTTMTGDALKAALPPALAALADRMKNGLAPVPALGVRTDPLVKQAVLQRQPTIAHDCRDATRLEYQARVRAKTARLSDRCPHMTRPPGTVLLSGFPGN
jgi:hypothetical protein